MPLEFTSQKEKKCKEGKGVSLAWIVAHIQASGALQDARRYPPGIQLLVQDVFDLPQGLTPICQPHAEVLESPRPKPTGDKRRHVRDEFQNVVPSQVINLRTP